MKINRRSFLIGGGSALGAWALPGWLWADEAKKPLLRFGVVSDVHIAGRNESPLRLKAALAYLARQNVDAVLFPGDIAHTGRISQIEAFAKIWFETFPNGRGPDGRAVELMISTGNHDAWVMGIEKKTEAERRADWLFHADNAALTWKRVLGIEWAPVWRREVKGFTFFGSQWPTYKPDLAGFMQQHGHELKGTKPVFYCQHQAPYKTCVGWTTSNDPAARLFADYPNLVAFSGHSHQTIADERTLWQGGFTSIGAGCLHEGGAEFSYENVGAFWHKPTRKHVMEPHNDPARWGGDPDGGCFEMVDVFDGFLRIERRSSVYDLPIGPDLIVTLPAQATKAAVRPAPVFPEGATVKVEHCEKGDPREGVAFKGQPCVRVTFPAARAAAGGRRVYDYQVTATGADGKKLVRKVIAPGFASPLAKSGLDGYCLFLDSELPAGKIAFEVTAGDSFGVRSKAIRADA